MTGGYCFLPPELTSAIVSVLESGESGEVTLPGIYKELQQILALRKFCLISPFNDMTENEGLLSTTPHPCSVIMVQGKFLLAFLFGGLTITMSVGGDDIIRLIYGG